MPQPPSQFSSTAILFVFLLSVPISLVLGVLSVTLGLLPSPFGFLLLLYAIVAARVSFKIGGDFFSLSDAQKVREFQFRFGKATFFTGLILFVASGVGFFWGAANLETGGNILVLAIVGGLLGSALLFVGDSKGEKLARLDAEIAQAQLNQATEPDAPAVDETAPAAAVGDPVQQVLMARQYFLGTGVEQDYHEALKWARLSAEQGNALAQRMVANFYEEGFGVAVIDHAEAAKWYALAAAQGKAVAQLEAELAQNARAAAAVDPMQQVLMAERYALGKDVEQDYKEALKWARLSAEQGNARGQRMVANFYEEGFGVVVIDHAEAAKWYALAAAQGEVVSQCALAAKYQSGQGVTQDEAEALRLYRAAAEQGNSVGQYYVGDFYEHGRSVAVDTVEALKWYQLAAAQGHGWAQSRVYALTNHTSKKAAKSASAKSALEIFMVVVWGAFALLSILPFRWRLSLFVFGLFALFGWMMADPFEDGIAAYKHKDYATALKLLRPFAIKGNATAQYNLGVMYDEGQGVAQSDAEAMKWYKLAAAQGGASAQHNLGVMYDKGQGVAQDYVEAMKWFKLAAAQGDAKAQSNLGIMYRRGQGVAQDDAEAVKWYRLAAAQGDAGAQTNLGAMYARGLGVPMDNSRALMWFNLAASKGDATAQENRSVTAKKMTQQKIAEAEKLAQECQARNFKNCD